LNELRPLDADALGIILNFLLYPILQFPSLLLYGYKALFELIATKDDGKWRFFSFSRRELCRNLGFIFC
jgi:hypothetical protein